MHRSHTYSNMNSFRSFMTIGVLLYIVSCSHAKPLDSEGTRGLELQSSSNAVPRIGKRGEMRYVPSFTSGLIPSFPHLTSKQGKRSSLEQKEKRAPWTSSWPNFNYNTPTKPKTNKKSGEQEEEKRMPWTSSWANILYKPQPLRKDEKRSAIPDAWGTPWDNFLKSKQGFRLTDGHDSYLNNAVLYKRAQNHIQELNSVPMLGKREAELAFFGLEDGTGSEQGGEEDWNLGFEDGPRSDNSALYPPVVGPHYRTILTRVQRSVNSNNHQERP